MLRKTGLWGKKMNSDLDLFSHVEISSRKSETQFWSSGERSSLQWYYCIHEQRKLAGCRPSGCKELDTIELPSTHACPQTHTHTHTEISLWLNQKEERGRTEFLENDAIGGGKKASWKPRTWKTPVWPLVCEHWSLGGLGCPWEDSQQRDGKETRLVRPSEASPLTLDVCCGRVACLVTQSHPTLWPHGLQPAGLLCPWNSAGKNTGVGCHFLFQGIFPTQGSNLCLLCLLR